MVAYVVNLVGSVALSSMGVLAVKVVYGLGNVVQHAHGAFGNVVYIRKVALHFPVVEHVNRLVLHDGFCKEPGSHVGSTPRAIHRKVA